VAILQFNLLKRALWFGTNSFITNWYKFKRFRCYSCM